MTPDGFPAHIQAALDAKTKPPGSLGRLEELAARIAGLQGRLAPRLDRCGLMLFAADHGLAAEGVSAYPQAVTGQMVRTILAGGAASTVFARSLGIAVRVIDAGMVAPIDHPDLIDRRCGPGTANAAIGPAMTGAQARQALEAGRALGAAAPWPALCLGEMGIGNTASASLLAHTLLDLPLERLIGPGAGLDAAGLARKRAVLARVASRLPARPAMPMDALRAVGGFEIAMLAGAMLGAAAARRLVLVDGFIATVAALIAVRTAPGCRSALLFAHRSAEPGHGPVLAALGAEPLFDLGLRLGEGTGALLAWPLARAAASMLAEMASFDTAGVSGPL